MNVHAEMRPVESDPLEQAGQHILDLIHKAAAFAEQRTQNAVNAANGLAFQLRAAEERIRELEATVRFQYARADHAEEWLKRISNEIAQTLPTSQSAMPPSQSANVTPAASPHPPGIEFFVKGRRKVG